MNTDGPADGGSAVARAGDHARKANNNPHFDDCLISASLAVEQDENISSSLHGSVELDFSKRGLTLPPIRTSGATLPSSAVSVIAAGPEKHLG